MMLPRAVKLALIAPSGSGKSTVAGLLEQAARKRGLVPAIVKLAAPLYRLQAEIYRVARVPLRPGDQHQKILESLAQHLRDVNPRAIVDDFLTRLAAVEADVVINDDIRDCDVDWPALRAEGFRAVRIRAPEAIRVKRLSVRNDAHAIMKSSLDAIIARIPSDIVVDNGAISIAQLGQRVDMILAAELERIDAAGPTRETRQWVG
jgi:dephospho-CoA kinase